MWEGGLWPGHTKGDDHPTQPCVLVALAPRLRPGRSARPQSFACHPRSPPPSFLPSFLHSSDSCRFQPRLTRRAKQRQPRSYSEMSVGDAKRREASVRITKLEQERDVADTLSFEPKLHQGAVAARLAQVIDGKLKVTSDPDTCVALLLPCFCLVPAVFVHCDCLPVPFATSPPTPHHLFPVFCVVFSGSHFVFFSFSFSSPPPPAT